VQELVAGLLKKATKTLFANANSTPEWLSDANIDAFMASVDAPATVLA